MFCYAVLSVDSSFTIIFLSLIREIRENKREKVHLKSIFRVSY